MLLSQLQDSALWLKLGGGIGLPDQICLWRLVKSLQGTPEQGLACLKQ